VAASAVAEAEADFAEEEVVVVTVEAFAEVAEVPAAAVALEAAAAVVAVAQVAPAVRPRRWPWSHIVTRACLSRAAETTICC